MVGAAASQAAAAGAAALSSDHPMGLGVRAECYSSCWHYRVGWRLAAGGGERGGDEDGSLGAPAGRFASQLTTAWCGGDGIPRPTAWWEVAMYVLIVVLLAQMVPPSDEVPVVPFGDTAGLQTWWLELHSACRSLPDGSVEAENACYGRDVTRVELAKCGPV